MKKDDEVVMMSVEDYEQLEHSLKFWEMSTYLLQYRITEGITKTCVCENCLAEFAELVIKEPFEGDVH